MAEIEQALLSSTAFFVSTGILASAGVAGVVFGLAAQRTLSNLPACGRPCHPTPRRDPRLRAASDPRTP